MLQVNKFEQIGARLKGIFSDSNDIFYGKNQKIHV